MRAATSELASAMARVQTFADADVMSEQRECARVRRALDAYESALAGEVAHRSRRELGHSGLAQRQGFRSPEALVQAITGGSAREASTLVHVGGLLNGESPWLAPVAEAVTAGDLSASAAKAISVGLGVPEASEGRQVGADELAAAAQALVDQAIVAPCEGSPAQNPTSVDELARRARELRDELDVAGVIERETAIYDDRFMRRTRRSDGLYRYTINPDIESAAFIDDVFDRIMAPRRSNGPRFVDPADKAWAESISTDSRTPDQYLHDSFVDLLRLAVQSNSTESRRIVGSRMPAVRILVAKPSLESGDGVGHIEGQPLPVSIATVERAICSAGTVEVMFDQNARAIDLGREQRLFTPNQKLALSARDGGCAFEDCTVPASMTEAHHINHWSHGGKTDLADGILLCRFHHMLLHNNGWQVKRDDHTYWLIPPRDYDPQQTPRRLRSKSPALRDLLMARNTG